MLGNQTIKNNFAHATICNIYLQAKYPHDPGGRGICQIKEYLEKLYDKP